jgi:hypothetical protein
MIPLYNEKLNDASPILLVGCVVLQLGLGMATSVAWIVRKVLANKKNTNLVHPTEMTMESKDSERITKEVKLKTGLD